MNQDGLRRGLAWGLAVTLTVPVMVAVVSGLGALLAGLGDPLGAKVCGWVGVGLGVTWLTAVVGTVALNALAVLAPPRRSGRDTRRRGRRRRPSPVDRLAAERAGREGSA